MSRFQSFATERFLGTWLSVALLRYLDGIRFEFQTIKRPFCKKVDEFVLPLISTVNADHCEFLLQSVSLASLCARSDVISDSLDKIWQLQCFINELYFVQMKQCGFSGLRQFNASNNRVTFQRWFCLFLILLIIVCLFHILLVLVLSAPHLHNGRSVGSPSP